MLFVKRVEYDFNHVCGFLTKIKISMLVNVTKVTQ